MRRVILCSLLLLSFKLFAIMPYSLRMRGLNPELVGIVDDEYSDLFFNPAYINKISGHRLYTNLSNLHNTGQDSFLGANFFSRYGLLGGITNWKEHKFGGILELAGENESDKFIEYETDNEYPNIWIDSTLEEASTIDQQGSLNLFYGREFYGLKFGAFFGPNWRKYRETESEISKSYYYYGQVLDDYNYAEERTEYQDEFKSWPVMCGIVKDFNSSELSWTLSLGLEPARTLDQYLTKDISQSLNYLFDDYQLMLDNAQENGRYLSSWARYKLRDESKSLSLLAGLSYTNRPLSLNLFESTATRISNANRLSLDIERSEQKIHGPLHYTIFALGVGTERYFNLGSSKQLLALAVIPRIYWGNTKLIIEPELRRTYHYHNYPDTLEYITEYTNNEQYDFKERFQGLEVMVPVGIEAALSSRLTLRLGATQSLLVKFKDLIEVNLTDYGERTVYRELFPRDTTITTEEPQNALDAYYAQYESKLSWNTFTQYYFGASFKLSEQLSLDFLNFSELTKLNSWTLGLSIRF